MRKTILKAMPAASTNGIRAKITTTTYGPHRRCSTSQKPGERDLRRLCTLVFSDVEHRLGGPYVVVVIFALIPFVDAAGIAFGIVFRTLHPASQETAPERTERHEADAQLAQDGDHIRFEIALAHAPG